MSKIETEVDYSKNISDSKTNEYLKNAHDNLDHFVKIYDYSDNWKKGSFRAVNMKIPPEANCICITNHACDVYYSEYTLTFYYKSDNEDYKDNVVKCFSHDSLSNRFMVPIKPHRITGIMPFMMEYEIEGGRSVWNVYDECRSFGDNVDPEISKHFIEEDDDDFELIEY